MSDTQYIQVTHRELPYSTFDADNHLYENGDALTKFLPREYEGVIKYVEINGRTKLAIRDHITDYIPNPTFGKVAAPGEAGMDITRGGGGFGSSEVGLHRKKMLVMPGIDAFFDPEPRLELMKEMGIDRTLLWPTLASALEERVADDPDVAVAVIHALNQWMHEHWSYVYSDAIYSTPIISLAAGVDRALEELEFVHERGAKIFLIRVAPVPTWKGRKSFALPEFDPFWERVQELDIVVGMHSGDPGYHRYLNEWEGLGGLEMSIAKGARRANPTFVALSSEKDNLIDAMASIIGHGLATRFPRLKFMPVEYGSRWIRPFYAEAAAGVRLVAHAVRREPGRTVQPQRVGARVSRARPQGPHRYRYSRRPHHVRVGLSAPGGDGRPLGVLRSREGPFAGPAGRDHGRISREGDEGRQVRRVAAPVHGRERGRRVSSYSRRDTWTTSSTSRVR